jgi:hypothetical protein
MHVSEIWYACVRRFCRCRGTDILVRNHIAVKISYEGMFRVLEEALVCEAWPNYVCVFYSAVVMKVEVTSFRREMHTHFSCYIFTLWRVVCVYMYVCRISSASSLVVYLVMVASEQHFLYLVFSSCANDTRPLVLLPYSLVSHGGVCWEWKASWKENVWFLLRGTKISP